MGTKTEKLQLLSEVALFASCSKKELASIASVVDEIDVKPGTVLTPEGHPGKEFFVIAEGQAEVTLRGKRLAMLGPGEFFGEMSIIDPAPRAATVTAATPMRLYVLVASSFNAVLNEAPSVARSVLKGLVRRIRDLEQAPTY